MNTKKIETLQVRIERIKKKISLIEKIRPGSLSKQYNVCGNPTCRCKDPDNPKKHGPYFQLSYSRKGKSTSEFVMKEMVADVKKEIKNYQNFKKLMDEWIDLSMKIDRLRKEEYKNK